MKKCSICGYFKGFTAGMLIIILLASTLSGCKKENVNISIEDDDLDVSQSYFASHYIAKGQDGYYFLDTHNIMYFDAATHQTIPLCSKAECKHNSSECMSYINGLHKFYIFFYDGKLYWPESSGGMFTLMECGQDGSNHKKVASLCPYSDDTTIDFVFVNGYIYFTENGGNTISDNDKTIQLKRMSLDNKKIEDVYKYTGRNGVIQTLKAYSEDVYFIITEIEETGGNAFRRVGKGIYTSNVKSNETKKVIDDSVSDFCVDTKNKSLYYYVYSDGLYRVKDNNKEKITTATEQTGFCSLIYDGEYVYMDNSYWKFFSGYFLKQDYDIKAMIWIYDDGSLKTSIDMKEAGMTSVGENGDKEYYFDMQNEACFSKREFFETGRINWIEMKADKEIIYDPKNR